MQNITAIEADIRKVYASLATPTYRNVRLADIRPLLHATKREADKVLIDMMQRGGTHLRSEADQKTITPLDHLHAIVIAGRPRHTLLIEA